MFGPMQPGVGVMNPMFGYGVANPGFPQQNFMGEWAGVYNTNINMNISFIYYYSNKSFKVEMK